MLRIINILTYALITLIVAAQTCFAQEKKTEKDVVKDNIYMTWNKNTPESEMNDDIKALAGYGITITYADVKRNDKNEITGLKVTYADQNGNKGALELNNQKPINTIRFYKNGDELGFGSPSNAPEMLFAGGDFMDGRDFMKSFDYSPGGAQSFNFTFPEGQGFGNSKIIIKKDGKKTLIIEDGEVIEGGDDYTKEELEEIKKNNKMKHYGFGQNFMGLHDLEDLKDMRIDIEQSDEEAPLSKEELDKTRDEMIKAKEEMIKAKKEMEKAKNELKKSKSSLKTQKA